MTSPDGTPPFPGSPPGPPPPSPPPRGLALWVWAAVDVWAWLAPAAVFASALDYTAWAAWLDHPLTT